MKDDNINNAKKGKLNKILIALGLLGFSLHAAAAPVVIGSTNFSEQIILGNIYAQALKKHGIEAKTRLNLGNREIVAPALRSGDLDIVPEYIGALLNYFDRNASESTEQDITAALIKKLPPDLVILTPSQASDKTAWAVHADTAKKYNLKKISDLAPIANQLIIGGPPELATRSLGLAGFKRVYGIEFKSFKSLDISGPLTRLALNTHKIDVATIVTTQGDLSKQNWVVLQDDKHLQPSQNIVPLVRKAVLTPEISKTLNEVSAKLTTEDLSKLNQQVDLDHKDALSVATQWVNANISGK